MFPANLCNLSLPALPLTDIIIPNLYAIFAVPAAVGMFFVVCLVEALVLRWLLPNTKPWRDAFLVNLISRIASKQYKDTATIKLLTGLVLFPLAWLVAALLVGLGQIELHNTFAGIPRAPWAAGITTFLIGAFGGALALVYFELFWRTWTSIKIRAKRLWGSAIIRRLASERAALYEAVEEMRQGLDLPGDVLGDGRIGTRDFTLDPDDMP